MADRELMLSVTTAGPDLVAPTNPGTPVTHRHELTDWVREVEPRVLKALQAFDWGDKLALDLEVVFLGVHTSGVNMFRFDAFENLDLKEGRLEAMDDDEWDDGEAFHEALDREAPDGWDEVSEGLEDDAA